MLKETAKRAGIARPRIFTYMLRHSSATRNAGYLTDSELKLMYGWSISSRMTGTYVPLSGGDLDAKYQEIYGQGKVVTQPTFTPLICPRCHEKSPVVARYCVKCASPLEPEERANMTVKDEQTREDIAELRRLVEKSLSPSASAGGPGSSPGRTS